MPGGKYPVCGCARARLCLKTRDHMKRPYLICHMCTTIDGKILSKRWPRLAGPRSSVELFETTAASFGIDAWIVGTTTMREFSGRPQKLKRATLPIPPGDHVADPRAKSFAIGIDEKAALRFQKSDVDGDHTIVCITSKASNDYRAHLRAAGVSYLICGSQKVDLHLALDKLYRLFKLRKLMLEGGGKFNGSMLHLGLIDEISQITVPVVDGGIGISSFFDIPGRAPKKAAAALKLKSHRQLPGGIQWFSYTVRKK